MTPTQAQLGTLLAWLTTALCLAVVLVLLLTHSGVPVELWALLTGLGFAAAGITHPGASNLGALITEAQQLLAQLRAHTNPAGGAVPQPDTAPSPAPLPPPAAPAISPTAPPAGL